MNCDEFTKIIGDYVDRALDEGSAKRARAHVDACARCAAEVHELESTSMMIRSLERGSTSAGFEARLASRLASRPQRSSAGVWSTVRGRMRSAGRTLWGFQGHRQALRPVLTALLLCVVVVSSVLMLATNRPSVSDTDWAYINACKDQHASFAGANPLGDESAAALRERAGDLYDAM